MSVGIVHKIQGSRIKNEWLGSVDNQDNLGKKHQETNGGGSSVDIEREPREWAGMEGYPKF